jgi:hypothetical protein
LFVLAPVIYINNLLEDVYLKLSYDKVGKDLKINSAIKMFHLIYKKNSRQKNHLPNMFGSKSKDLIR